LGGSVSSPQASLGPSQHKLDAVLAAIDARANPATLEICTAAHATVLVTLTLSDPSFTHGGAKPNTALTIAGVPRRQAARRPSRASRKAAAR